MPPKSETPLTDQHERATLLQYGHHHVVEATFARRLERSHAGLLTALKDLIALVAHEELMPESLSYFKQARDAINTAKALK